MKRPKFAELYDWARVIAILVVGFLGGLAAAPLMIRFAWDFWD